MNAAGLGGLSRTRDGGMRRTDTKATKARQPKETGAALARDPSSRGSYRDEDDNLLGAGGWLAATRPRQGVQLLLVAKEGSFQKLLIEALEQRGHTVRAAGDGRAAIDIGCRERFDVCLLLVGPEGTPALMQRLRDLDPDLEVVWMPPPLS